MLPGAGVLFLSGSRVIIAFINSASNHHLTAVNADFCCVAQWLFVESISSSPDWLPWKLLAYFCLPWLGFFQAEVAIFGQINTLLFWERGFKSEVQMRSPLKAPAQQNNRQQDKTRTATKRRHRNRGFGNYRLPVLESGRPKAKSWGRVSERERELPPPPKKKNIFNKNRRKKWFYLTFCSLKQENMLNSWWAYFKAFTTGQTRHVCVLLQEKSCLCAAVKPWENGAHNFRGREQKHNELLTPLPFFLPCCLSVVSVFWQ